MYCPNCGNQITGDDAFCHECGAHIEQVAEPALQPMAQPQQGIGIQQSVYTQKDVRWTYRQVLVGKLAQVLVVDTALWVALFVAFAKQVYGSSLGAAIRAVATQLFYSTAEIATGSLSNALFTVVVIAVFVVVLIVLFLPVSALFVWLFYCLKDRNVAPTREAVEEHRRQARFRWRLGYAVFLGVFDAFFIYMVLDVIVSFVGIQAYGMQSIPSVVEIVVVVVSVGLAEYRIRRINKRLLSQGNFNERLIADILNDPEQADVPEGFVDELNIAKIVKLLDLGVAHSVGSAVSIIKLVNTRASLIAKSGFIGGFVSACANILTFGMVNILVGDLNGVTAAIAKGKSVTESAIAEKQEYRRRFIPIFEIVALICVIVFVIWACANYGNANSSVPDQETTASTSSSSSAESSSSASSGSSGSSSSSSSSSASSGSSKSNSSSSSTSSASSARSTIPDLSNTVWTCAGSSKTAGKSVALKFVDSSTCLVYIEATVNSGSTRFDAMYCPWEWDGNTIVGLFENMTIPSSSYGSEFASSQLVWTGSEFAWEDDGASLGEFEKGGDISSVEKAMKRYLEQSTLISSDGTWTNGDQSGIWTLTGEDPDDAATNIATLWDSSGKLVQTWM